MAGIDSTTILWHMQEPITTAKGNINQEKENFKIQLILELLVSYLGVVDQRSDKEAANIWLLPKFNLICKCNNFWSTRRCP